MTTIDLHKGGGAGGVGDDRPYHERYTHQPHWRTKEAEFDGIKLGMWLFLATEVLLFAGMFCGYAVFRMLYPQAWANGSHYLDWRWGCSRRRAEAQADIHPPGRLAVAGRVYVGL